MRLATRLDRYPGKMVSRLARRLIRQYTAEGDSVIDPFCGSAAILLAASEGGCRVLGIDVNPIAELFCRVKIGGFNSACARKLCEAWIAEAQRATLPLAVNWEGKHYWFTPSTLNKFERLRAASKLLRLVDSPECWPVLLSYVLAVRLCSRADQRSPKPFISQQARQERSGRHFDPNRIILDLLEQLSALYGDGDRNRDCHFVRADICDPCCTLTNLGTHSHAITSPPYINAQDYFRNFKLELYLLEGILPFEVDDIRGRFIGTERGRLLEGVPQESIDRDLTIAPVLAELRNRAPRLCAVVHRYLYDMSNAFDAVRRKLQAGACLVVVCGDNLVGGLRVCTWDLLHQILEEKGFTLFDRFRDPIRDRLLPPMRLGHRGLIKEEVVSAYRLKKRERSRRPRGGREAGRSPSS